MPIEGTLSLFQLIHFSPRQRPIGKSMWFEMDFYIVIPVYITDFIFLSSLVSFMSGQGRPCQTIIFLDVQVGSVDHVVP